jgi:5-methylcytosine-specific restriction endonuclease McrA
VIGSGGDCAAGTEIEVRVSFENCPALVLNADFRPLSYFPLSLWPWQEAVKAVVTDRVNVVSEYDRVVRSPSFELPLPSVISLKEYISQARRPAFTRFNVFLRDRFTCQYCGVGFPTHELTFDHVVPRSRGGRTTWGNVVSACAPCNLRKGGRMPTEGGLYPFRTPRQPSVWELQENGRAFPPNFLHESWRDFLYWDTELDSS